MSELTVGPLELAPLGVGKVPRGVFVGPGDGVQGLSAITELGLGRAEILHCGVALALALVAYSRAGHHAGEPEPSGGRGDGGGVSNGLGEVLIAGIRHPSGP